MKYSRYLLFFMAMALIAFALFTLMIQPALASGSTPSSITLDPSPTTSPTSVSSTPTPTATPNIQPVSTTNTIKVVHDQPIWFANPDAWLAPLLLPGETAQNYTLLINNQEKTTEILINPTLTLVGKTTGTVPTLADIKLPCSIKLQPSQTTSVTIPINSNMLVPDEYIGSVQYQIVPPTTSTSSSICSTSSSTSSTSSDSGYVDIMLDISVRNGPSWPIIVLLLGLFFGWLSRNMATPVALKQLHLIQDYIDLRDDIENMPSNDTPIIDYGPNNSTIIAKLTKYLQDIHGKIESSDASIKEDDVSQEITDLSTCITFFADYLPSYKDLNPGDDKKQNLGADAKKILLADNATDAAAQIQTFKKNYANLRDQTGGAPAAADQSDLGGMSPQDSPGEKQQSAKPLLWITSIWIWLQPFLTGDKFPVAELRYRVARPVLGGLLLLLLLLIGLETLYVQAGTTFGAAGLYDYLGLVLWGFSSAVASSTFQSLPTMLKGS